MFKRIIAVSVLGVSALAMMTANATTNGFYVDGQVGYAHTNNQLKGLLSDDITANKTKKASKGEIAARLAIGYQFTPNWAVELGYLQLGKQKSNLLITKYMNSPIIGVPTGDIAFDPEAQTIIINQHAFDIVGKGIYPISEKFSVYAKAGMAYLTTTVKANGATYTVKDDYGIYREKPLSVAGLFSKHNWAPEAGIGFTYDITPSVFIDTSFTHIQPIGKNKPANIDFATVGIGYSFG